MNRNVSLGGVGPPDKWLLDIYWWVFFNTDANGVTVIWKLVIVRCVSFVLDYVAIGETLIKVILGTCRLFCYIRIKERIRNVRMCELHQPAPRTVNPQLFRKALLSTVFTFALSFSRFRFVCLLLFIGTKAPGCLPTSQWECMSRWLGPPPPSQVSPVKPLCFPGNKRCD